MVICYNCFRGLPVFGGAVLPEQGNGLLLDPDIHPQHAHRHPLLGVLLDLGRRLPRPSRSRDHDSTHHDDPELGSATVTAQGEI